MSLTSRNESNVCSGSRKFCDSDDDVLYPDCKISPRKRTLQEELITSNKKRKRNDTPVEENEGTSTSVEESEGYCMVHEIKGSNKILFDHTYFQIIEKRWSTNYERKMGGIVAICKLCSNKVKGSLGVSSNFINHLKVKHLPHYNEYNERKAAYLKNKRDENYSVSEKFLKFVADTYSPLSIVENQSFLDLFKGTAIKIPTRKYLTNFLQKKYEEHVAVLKEMIASISYCCTTADIWSAGHGSFFGYTCHWIDSKTFQRRSVALAFRRFKGSHTVDKISDMITSIHREFNLNESKIVRTITDNGSNFFRAFKEFGASNEDELNDAEDGYGSNDEEVPRFPEISPSLPKHFRCSSRTLNLLFTTDYMNIIKKNEEIFSKHKQALNRCSTLWNKCKRPMTSEIINNLIFCSLKTPTVTSCNSLFDAISHILEYKEKLTELCALLHIPKFNIEDIEYLEQYCIVLAPIANALDFLQREENIYFGYLIATLVSLKVKLRKIYESGKITFLRFVCHELQTRLVDRFKMYFEMNDETLDAVVAAISCPNIKLNFCNVLFETAQTCTTEAVKQVFLNYAKSDIEIADQNAINEVVAEQDSNFLDFGENQSSLTDGPTVKMKRELELYLIDMDTSIECLKRYPRICKIFLKYNTTIPSSAPVERLISFAGIFNSSSRKNLVDSNFEKLLLLRANDSYV